MKAFYGIIASVLIGSASVANAQCVDGTISAELQTDGPHAGLYKYTVVMNWSTTQGLSNVTLDCGFGGETVGNGIVHAPCPAAILGEHAIGFEHIAVRAGV